MRVNQNEYPEKHDHKVLSSELSNDYRFCEGFIGVRIAPVGPCFCVDWLNTSRLFGFIREKRPVLRWRFNGYACCGRRGGGEGNGQTRYSTVASLDIHVFNRHGADDGLVRMMVDVVPSF